MWKDYKIVDISIDIQSFVYPGDPEVKIEGPISVVESTPLENEYNISMCTQSGTHIQGVHYFSKEGRRINEYGLEDFEGDAYVLDIPSKVLHKDFFEQKLVGIDLQGRILILRSGFMDNVIKTKEFDLNSLERPRLYLDAAKFLLTTGIKILVIDSWGIEPAISKDFIVNRTLTQGGILILETVANLGKISKKWVYLEAFPLPIKGVEGTPCRAIVRERI